MFLRRIIYVDGTWIYHITPENPQQSNQRAVPGDAVSKKVKVGLSTNTVMATAFWECIKLSSHRIGYELLLHSPY